MSVKPVRRSGYRKSIYTTMDKYTKFNLAAKACETRDKETARKYLNEIIEEDPDMSEAYRLLGQLSYEEGKDDEATNYLITALVKDPQNMWALIMMGNILGKRKKDIDAARTYFNKVLEYYPNNPIALNNLAATMVECGETEEAIEVFKKVMTLDNTYPNCYFGLALAYDSLDKNKEAFDVALEGAKKGVDRPENKSVRTEILRILLHEAEVLCKKTNYMNVVLGIKEELEGNGNPPIELVYDDKLKVYAKLEYYKHHFTDKNVVRYNGSLNHYEHLVVHELGHLRMLQANEKAHTGKVVYSTDQDDNNFNRKYGSQIRRALKGKISSEKLVDIIKHIHEAIGLQLFNSPLDLFVERYIYEHYPVMRPIQLLMLFKQEQDNIEGVKSGSSTEAFPPNIVKANKLMNICTSLHFKRMYGIDLINEYHPTKADFAQAKDLFDEFEAYWNAPDFKPGEEYDLVDYFLASLNMEDIITISDEESFINHLREQRKPVSVDGGDYDLYTEEEKERQRNFEKSSAVPDPARDFMMTMYILGALEYLKDKTKPQVRKIAQEIAFLGMNGITPSQKSGYSIPSIPGKDMGGYEMLAYYYSSWKLAIPEMAEQLGLPYKDAYNNAQLLFKQKYGSELKF